MIVKSLENRAPVFEGFDYIRICMGNAPAKKIPRRCNDLGGQGVL